MATTLAPRATREKRKPQPTDAPPANDNGASAGMPMYMSDPSNAEDEEFDAPVAVAAQPIGAEPDATETSALEAEWKPPTADGELKEQDVEAELPKEPEGEAAPSAETEDGKKEKDGKKKGASDKAAGEKGEIAAPAEGEQAADEMASVLATDDTAGAAAVRAEAAVASLGEIGATVSTLGGERVTFAPDATEVAAGADTDVAKEKRATAEAMASDFIAGNAGQIQTVLAFAAVVPGRIGAAAESSKAGIDAAIESARSAVMARCASARMQALGAAAGARARIIGEHAATVGAINASTLQSHTAIDGAHTAALGLVAVQEAAQLGRIATLYSTKDPIFRAAGTTVGDEAVAHGNKRKWEWLDQRDYEDDILDGPYHDNKLKARADAAVAVADAYKKGLVQQANDEADAAKLGMPKDLVTVNETATQSRAAIDSMYEQSIAGLEAAQTQAIAAAESAKGKMLASVSEALGNSLSGFAVEEMSQLAALTQFGESQKIAVDRDAAAAVVSLVEGVASAASALSDALVSFSGATRTSPPPDAPVLAQQLALAQADFDQMAAGTIGQLDQGLALSEAGVLDAGAQSVSAATTMMQAGIDQVGAAASAFVTSANGIATGAASAFGEMRQSHAEGAAQTTAGSIVGFLSVNGMIAKAFNETATNLDKNFEEAAKNLTTGLRKYVSDKLDTDINTEADKAADQVQPRWKSVLKVLLVIAVIVVVALVAGPAVIGAIGAAAGALGASAAAAATIGTIVGGAIVGAASGAVIQIGNNVIDQIGGDWSLGKTFDGVGKAMVVGAIGGALGGVGAVLGKGASALFTSGFGKFVVDTGVNMIGDVTGGLLGDLAVGNPITLEGVLIGAGIGLGIGIAGSNLGKLGKFGKSIEGVQGRSMKVGEKIGDSVGTSIANKLGVKPKVTVDVAPKVNVTEPTSKLKIDEPTAAPKVEEPSAKPKIEEPASKPKIEEPASKPKVEEPAPKPKVEEHASKPKVEEPSAAPKLDEPTPGAKVDEPSAEPRASHKDHPEIEEGVVAKEATADGHEVKVLKDGRIAVCSDCGEMRLKYDEELTANPKLKKKLDTIEGMKDPKAKAKAAKALEVELKGARADAKAKVREAAVDDAKKLIGKNRKFEDPALEQRYQDYRDRKGPFNKKRGRADWKVESDFWMSESPTVRGNKFNKTAGQNYDYNEVHLANGKRCDSFDPDANGGRGEIISRKAVDFTDMDESIFRSYLKEMKLKYKRGTRINSPKYADDAAHLGTKLKGDYVLEVPASNQGLPEAARLEAMAAREGIKIRYTPE